MKEQPCSVPPSPLTLTSGGDGWEGRLTLDLQRVSRPPIGRPVIPLVRAPYPGPRTLFATHAPASDQLVLFFFSFLFLLLVLFIFYWFFFFMHSAFSAHAGIVIYRSIGTKSTAAE